MKPILSRLERLEALPSIERVRVVFSDGTTRRMDLPSVIPLLVETNSPHIVEIDTERTSNGDGHLLELVRGLLEVDYENR